MKILVMGGTGFVARYVVEKLVAHHHVTLFNRGSDKNLFFPNIKRITGDRNNQKDLDLLTNYEWDCVVDLGYTISHISSLVNTLKSVVPYYVFISTDAINQLGDSSYCEENPEDSMCKYVMEKILCENYIIDNFPNKYLILRPTYICGKYDDTNRFDYGDWPTVYFKGSDEPIQYDDGNVLAEQIQTHIDTKTKGIF